MRDDSWSKECQTQRSLAKRRNDEEEEEEAEQGNLHDQLWLDPDAHCVFAAKKGQLEQDVDWKLSHEPKR